MEWKNGDMEYAGVMCVVRSSEYRFDSIMQFLVCVCVPARTHCTYISFMCEY
jgi:hypothetical protein